MVVIYWQSRNHLDDSSPCVVLASPGMMQSGLSRELFENWCTDKRNGVIIAGYCVEGTPAKQILSQPAEVPTMSGQMLPLKCSVEYISFSAHTDYQQTSEFIRELKPNYVVSASIFPGKAFRCCLRPEWNSVTRSSPSRLKLFRPCSLLVMRKFKTIDHVNIFSWREGKVVDLFWLRRSAIHLHTIFTHLLKQRFDSDTTIPTENLQMISLIVNGNFQGAVAPNALINRNVQT